MSLIHADTASEETEKNREIFRDLAVGCISIIGAITLGLSHIRQEGRLHDDYGAEPGPAMLPELLLFSLAIVGLLLVLRSLLTRQSKQSTETTESELTEDSSSASIWAFAVLALSVLACLSYPYVGFGLMAAALGAALCSLLAYQESRSVPRATIEGLLVVLFLYGVFRFILSVPLT